MVRDLHHPTRPTHRPQARQDLCQPTTVTREALEEDLGRCGGWVQEFVGGPDLVGEGGAVVGTVEKGRGVSVEDGQAQLVAQLLPLGHVDGDHQTPLVRGLPQALP